MKKRITKEPSVVLNKFHIEEGSNVVRVQSNIVKNKKLAPSSKNWLSRHINDEFTQKSKAFGYRARSAFKLLEIQEKFNIINQYDRVLDLGCAPGSWSEVLVKFTKNQVIGIDLLETTPIMGTIFLKGDFLDNEIQKKAIELNNNKKFNVIVSDIAPDTTGIKTVDHLRIMYVLEIEIQFISNNLEQSGNFVAKVFQGEGLEEQINILKTIFKEVKIFKPKASRKESKEIYLICTNYYSH